MFPKVLWVSFSSHTYIFGLLTFVKNVILGLHFAFCRAKYVHVKLSQQENNIQYKQPRSYSFESSY